MNEIDVDAMTSVIFFSTLLFNLYPSFQRFTIYLHPAHLFQGLHLFRHLLLLSRMLRDPSSHQLFLSRFVVIALPDHLLFSLLSPVQ